MYAVIYTSFSPIDGKCVLSFTPPVDGKVCGRCLHCNVPYLAVPPVDGKVCGLCLHGSVPYSANVATLMGKCVAAVHMAMFPHWWKSVCQCFTHKFSPLMEMSVHFDYKYPHGGGSSHSPGGPFPTIDRGGVASVHSVTMCLWSFVYICMVKQSDWWNLIWFVFDLKEHHSIVMYIIQNNSCVHVLNHYRKVWVSNLPNLQDSMILSENLF